MILAEPRHEPKVRQGVTTEIVGVDGNGFAPFARRQDLELRRLRLRARWPARHRLRLAVGGRLPGPLRRHGQRQRRHAGRQLASCASMPWAGTTCPPTTRAIDRMRGAPPRGDGRRRGRPQLRARLPAGQLRHDRGAGRADRGRPARPAASTTRHVRYPLGDRFLDPFREAIEIGRRADAPSHITHFYHRQTHPGGPEQLLALVDDARAEGLDVTFDTYPSEWASTRLLIQLPALDPGRRPGPAQGAAGRPAGARPAARRARGARRGLHQPGRLGRCPARCLPAARPAALGVAHDGRGHGRDRPRRGRCHLRPAAGRGPRRQPGHERAVDRDAAPVHRPPGRDGRHGLARSSAPSRARGRTARSRASSASSCATRRCSRLEAAIHKMTGAPAARLGPAPARRAARRRVRRRRRVRPGDRPHNATYDEPRQFPTGIEHVLVNGVSVVGRRRRTPAPTPGRGIRLGATAGR